MERFLAAQGFERGPWLAVGLAAGIGAWFVLASWRQWLALAAALLAAALMAARMRSDTPFPYLRQALATMPLMALAGLGVVWAKSALVGAPPIARPLVAEIAATVLDRAPQAAQARVQLVIATREPGTGRAIRARLNVPLADDRPGLADGARVRVRARLIPPAPPMLPGGYDFARTAWFAGLAATGSALGPIEVVAPSPRGDGWLERLQAALSAHVRARLPGSAGTIAAALASGDQGAIARADQDAMRDAGLSHLLSISGLHVSAVIGAGYVLALRLLALWPWLALRVRLPVVAAGFGALAGVGYTLLTGSQVPTMRSCFTALLVLAALALGREALSLRLLAVAAFLVMLLWPEAVAGPSFQLSFAAVIAIIALHASAPMRRYLRPREEHPLTRLARAVVALLVTGAAVELALMPIGLYHFHRAGLYGTVANVVAIPLTELVVMPLTALALLLDCGGLGAPAWWADGLALNAMLAMARWIAARPGAVTLLPAMGGASIALFVVGGLWLALWRGSARLWGLAPVALGTASLLLLLRPPDLLVAGDGRHVGIVGETPDGLLVLRASRNGYTGETLAELAGMNGPSTLLADWPAARCTADFCAITLRRAGRDWRLLIARGHDIVPIGPLAAACADADIVVADRRLPRACRPLALKADAALLARTGGLAIDLRSGRVTSVAASEGEHGWWRPEQRRRAGDRGKIYPPRAAPDRAPADPPRVAAERGPAARSAAAAAAAAAAQ